MPVFERSYLSWEGTLRERPATWLEIARTGIKLAWRRSLGFLILISAVPFILKAAQVYAASRIGGSSFLAELAGGIQIDESFFLGFIKRQTFLVFLIAIVCGAGLIANDKKYKALTLYFSKPVGLGDYLAGKFLVVAFYMGLITVAPALMLFVGYILIDGGSTSTAGLYMVPLSIVAAGAVVIVSLGGFILALSSLARGTRTAAIAFFALIYIPDLLRRILSGSYDAGWISIRANILQVESILFTGVNPYGYPGWAGFAALSAVVILSAVVLKLRIRPTEVVR